ncbi:hypothetical protein [Ornithinibacillus xuwenensis]|uniref:DUF4367 domain-containing protein n=1 Tax=Ornithinibacillus xuwenensis TaxID=3144668 RepID=A0ABU9XJ90_9BACI
MGVKKYFGFVLLLLLSIVMVACSDDAAKEKDTDKQEEKSEETSKESEESGVPEDEELFAVLELNMQTLIDKDVDKHMETIHSESPLYDSTKQTAEMVFQYDIEAELSDLVVEEKSETEAKVRFTQTAIGSDGFTSNRISGVHTLKPDNGVWKIFGSEVEETVFLDENGEPLDNAVFAQIQGDYAANIKELVLPFEDKEVQLYNYQEDVDYAVAEVMMAHDQYSQVLVTIEYNKGASSLVDPETWVGNMETGISENVTGKLEFNVLGVTDTDAMYELSLTEDESLDDQAEVTRGFFKGDDLIIVSYTVMGEATIDEAVKAEWIEELKTIQ